MAQRLEEVIRVRVPAELKARLEEMATPRLLTASDIAREALRLYVEAADRKVAALPDEPLPAAG